MSMGREYGSRTGGGGVMNQDQMRLHTRRMQGEIFQDLIDLSKDPYFQKNHLGSFECRLCLTTHQSEENYLAHTKGRRHRMGLQTRARIQSRGAPSAMSSTAASAASPSALPASPSSASTSGAAALGGGRAHPSGGMSRQLRIQPGGTSAGPSSPYHYVRQISLVPRHRVEKTCSLEEGRHLLVKLEYPKINPDIQPEYRFISAVEQVVEPQMDLSWQYLVVAAAPYRNVAIKIPAWILSQPSFNSQDFWDPVRRFYEIRIRCGFPKDADADGPQTTQS